MQVAPVIVNRGAEAEILPLQFGNTIQGVGRVVGNARAETILEKHTFKRLLASHRCLIPTTGFIDWETDEEGEKWPHLFTLFHGRPYAMAAIWNPGSAELQVPAHFFIVTVAPNEVVAKYHDRMPVILPDNKLSRWLDSSPMEQAEFLEFAQSCPAAEMQERAISEFANNVRHEGPECLAAAKPRPEQFGLGF